MLKWSCWCECPRIEYVSKLFRDNSIRRPKLRSESKWGEIICGLSLVRFVSVESSCLVLIVVVVVVVVEESGPRIQGGETDGR